MYEKGMHLSIIYCLCFVEDISANMTEKQVMEETDPYLRGQEGLMVADDREDKRKEVEDKEKEDRGKLL